MGSHHCLLLRTGTMDCVAMEAEKKAAALKAAALVDKPVHALIAVNVDSREAELSWLGTWLVYFLVATVEIIISAANATFNQILFPCFNKADGKMNEQAVPRGSSFEWGREGLEREDRRPDRVQCVQFFL